MLPWGIGCAAPQTCSDLSQTGLGVQERGCMTCSRLRMLLFCGVWSFAGIGLLFAAGAGVAMPAVNTSGATYVSSGGGQVGATISAPFGTTAGDSALLSGPAASSVTALASPSISTSQQPASTTV